MLTPASSPTILYNPIQGLFTSPQTAFMDLNVRLSNSILKAKVNGNINVMYGV